jgi:hypothetical protein
MGRFSSRNTTVRFEDFANFGMLIGPGPGDFSHGAINSENAERLRAMDRNRFDCFVVGDDLEQEWSLTVFLRNQSQTDAVLARVNDFIQRTGSFAPAFTQTVDLNPDIWAFRVIVIQTLGTTSSVRTLPHNVADQAFAEAKEANSITITGRNNGVIAPT